MTIKSSVKLYLTIFLMTTCIYMILYQYHLSGAQILSQTNNNEIKVVEKYEKTNHNDDYRLIERKFVKQSLQQQQQQQQQETQQQQADEEEEDEVFLLDDSNNIQAEQNAQEFRSRIRSNRKQYYFKQSIDNTFKKASTTTTQSSSQSSQSQSSSTLFANNAAIRPTSTTTSTKKLLSNSATINSAFPPLYIITPTYKRPEQLAELTRLGYTLKHVINLLWLVVEDSEQPSKLVTKKLQHIGVPFVHLIAPMPQQYRKSKAIPRGVSNRNRALEWLRANATEGVFYFADDDNTYDVTIFEQMRYTKKVSMWPVGLVTKLGVSSPIIRNGKFDGFYDGWIGGRKFPVDMAGFAVSVKFLLERPNAKMPYKGGYEEDGFLKSLQPFNNTQIELLASSCTEVLTWHTQTKKNAPAAKLNMTRYSNTNLVELTKSLVGK